MPDNPADDVRAGYSEWTYVSGQWFYLPDLDPTVRNYMLTLETNKEIALNNSKEVTDDDFVFRGNQAVQMFGAPLVERTVAIIAGLSMQSKQEIFQVELEEMEKSEANNTPDDLGPLTMIPAEEGAGEEETEEEEAVDMPEAPIGDATEVVFMREPRAED